MTPKPIQLRVIVENFPKLVSLERGHLDTYVDQIQSGTLATPRSLVFVSSREHLSAAASSPAEVWVVAKNLVAEVPACIPNVLSSPNCYLALAQIGSKYFTFYPGQEILRGPKIHARSIIAESAQIGEDCRIDPGAVIGENVSIGARTWIGANSVIEPNVKIGADTRLHPLVFVAHGCVIGDRCEIKTHTAIGGEGYGYAHDASFNHYRVTHFGRVVIEDDVHIGSGVQIDRGTFEDSWIGAGVRIDNHCHFGHNIRVGKNTLITASMITAGSTTFGANCVFGGRITTKGHLSVADGVQVAGISGIGKSILEKGEYGGFPLQPIQDEMRTRAALKQLPDLIKKVRKILKNLAITD